MSLKVLASRSTQDIVKWTRALVPPLLPKFHKGQLGRILVFGGEFNGAVYFAADAAAKTGADLVHVVCTRDVAQVIKSYSPDLMVHPWLVDQGEKPEGQSEQQVIDSKVMPKVGPLLDKIDVVAIGSGLGRELLNLQTAETVIKEVIKRKLPIVMDADSLFLLSLKPQLIQGYDKAILTPNVMEFKRIFEKLDKDGYKPSKDPKDPSLAIKLSKLLGGVTIVQKGPADIIARNDDYLINDSPGSNRRCGGQGDTLSGALSVFVGWGEKYKANLWDHSLNGGAGGEEIDEKWIPLLAAFAGGSIVRRSSLLAFNEKKRSMQASDLHKQIPTAFEQIFGPSTLDVQL